VSAVSLYETGRSDLAMRHDPDADRDAARAIRLTTGFSSRRGVW